jgi:copper homeostasis protein CutC
MKNEIKILDVIVASGEKLIDNLSKIKKKIVLKEIHNNKAKESPESNSHTKKRSKKRQNNEETKTRDFVNEVWTISAEHFSGTHNLFGAYSV